MWRKLKLFIVQPKYIRLKLLKELMQYDLQPSVKHLNDYDNERET